MKSYLFVGNDTILVSLWFLFRYNIVKTYEGTYFYPTSVSWNSQHIGLTAYIFTALQNYPLTFDCMSYDQNLSKNWHNLQSFICNCHVRISQQTQSLLWNNFLNCYNYYVVWSLSDKIKHYLFFLLIKLIASGESDWKSFEREKRVGCTYSFRCQ